MKRCRGSSTRDPASSRSSQHGITLVEYLIIAVGVALVLYFLSALVAPKTSQYFSKRTPGLDLPYPNEYIPAPCPSPSGTATPGVSLGP